MNPSPVVVTPEWPTAGFANRVAEAPEPNGDTADLTLMAMLMLARRGAGGTGARSGLSLLHDPVRTGALLSGRTLGLVGFDEVAREVARRAHHGFGMDVLVHEPSPIEAEAAITPGATWRASLREVLAEADFVAIRSPGERPTAPTIDARCLDQMKPSAFLIDTSGGRAIDHQALVHALWFETIAGVALRVDPGQSRVVADLTACPNALLLMHQNERFPG